MKKRILVCGGREFREIDYLNVTLDVLRPTMAVLIHGCAPGADTLADLWAERNKVIVIRFPADWKRYGRGAGPKRNAEMIKDGKPDLVVAFPGGSGTADLKRRARLAGIPILER